jgi:hypothetical protein
MKISGKLVRRKGYCVLGKRIVPRGSNCFYWRLTKRRGLKVYYGLDREILCRKKTVEKIARQMNRLAKIGVTVKAHKVRPVRLNIIYNGQRVRCRAYGITTRHLDVKYDDGNKENEKQRIARRIEKHKMVFTHDMNKDANIGYDKRDKRYKLVDVA